jgi:phospholipid transport system substrate-binding protein
MIRSLAALATTAAALLAWSPGVAAQDVAPDALVRKSIDEVVGIIKADKELQNGNPKKLYALIEEKVLPHFDFTRMTRLAVGRSWSQASDGQKEALIKEFQTLLVRTYSISLSQYRDQKIDVKPAKLAAGDTDTVVRTVVIQSGGGQPIPIDYGMEHTAKGWKVYDVVVDGVSLVTTYRGSFNDQIQKSGDRRAREDARGPQPVLGSPEGARQGRPEEVSAGTSAEVLALEGALSFETLPRVLEESRAYSARPDVPDRLTIDFSAITEVDSSAVALLLEWRREAVRRGKGLYFVNLPANLLALAELYGVTGLVQPCRA